LELDLCMVKLEMQVSITSITIAKLNNNIYINKCITVHIKATHLEVGVGSKTVKTCDKLK
jgi:hypothetical protein